MTTPTSTSRLTGRTKLITAASIAGVILAALFAVGANLGILASTNDSAVGQVSAAGDLVPPATQVVDVYLDDQGNPVAPQAGTATTTTSNAQQFVVDAAGTVDVSVVGGRAHIDRISPTNGWTARTAPASGTDAAVAFTNGTRTLEFVASVNDDGSLAGEVTESTSPDGATPARPTYDDEDHDDGGDDREGDDDHDYEGGDSDD